MLKEEKELRAHLKSFDMLGGGASKRITALVKAVREDAAKECDGMAEFYRTLRDKGPKEYSKTIDTDTLRMFAAEGCAAAIRRK